jgi:hypothetical protein
MGRKTDLSTIALAYEAVQRHFRKDVVHHLRMCLRDAFPETWQGERKRRLKPEDWTQRLRRERERGDFAAVHTAPAFAGRCPRLSPSSSRDPRA